MGDDDAAAADGGDGASTSKLVQWHVANDMPSEHSNVCSVAIIMDDVAVVDNLVDVERMLLPLEVVDRRPMRGVNLMVMVGFGFARPGGSVCILAGRTQSMVPAILFANYFFATFFPP